MLREKHSLLSKLDFGQPKNLSFKTTSTKQAVVILDSLDGIDQVRVGLTLIKTYSQRLPELGMYLNLGY